MTGDNARSTRLRGDPDDHTMTDDERRHDRADPYAQFGGFERLSHWLDTKFEVPGIPMRFGLDGLVGLVPGIGDAVTGIMGVYALKLAHDHDLPLGKRLAMIYNIAVDSILGSIPVLGDLFDFAFHAHRRNYHILKTHIEKNRQGPRPPTAT